MAGPQPLISSPVARFEGFVRAPGDKSCSHRAFLLSAVAKGRSRLSGVLEGSDVLATAAACRMLGAEVECEGEGRWSVAGVGPAGFQSPSAPLDMGNSGTGCRLLLGLAAGQGAACEFTGDASLSQRPMRRITEPLRQMGARFGGDDAAPDRLPIRLESAPLSAIDFALPVASAQVKSALLLAALGAEGEMTVRENRPSRDHSERMLRAFGAALSIERSAAEGTAIALRGPQALTAQDITVPGDPSSAAFLIAAALVSPHGDVTVGQVMSNETRDGFFRLADRMGAGLGAESEDEAAAGERIAAFHASSAALKGVSVPPELVAASIDEFPILAVLAAFAEGETVVSGAEELRVKESDRVSAVVAMLHSCGVEAEERPDGFTVSGAGGPPPGGGLVKTRGDHRIAMSALVLGTAARNPVRIDDSRMILTSYPVFVADMNGLGADIRPG